MKPRREQEAERFRYAGIGGLDDEEAQALAERVVWEVRGELAKDYEPVDGPAPSPEEVRQILASKNKRVRRKGGGR